MLAATERRGAQEAAEEQDTARINQLCAEGVEAADFLQTYVVQGKVGRAADPAGSMHHRSHKQP